MRDLVTTNDPVLLSYLKVLLEGAGIEFAVFDGNMSAVQGTLGAVAQRLAVPSRELGGGAAPAGRGRPRPVDGEVVSAAPATRPWERRFRRRLSRRRAQHPAAAQRLSRWPRRRHAGRRGCRSTRAGRCACSMSAPASARRGCASRAGRRSPRWSCSRSEPRLARSPPRMPAQRSGDARRASSPAMVGRRGGRAARAGPRRGELRSRHRQSAVPRQRCRHAAADALKAGAHAMAGGRARCVGALHGAHDGARRRGDDHPQGRSAGARCSPCSTRASAR